MAESSTTSDLELGVAKGVERREAGLRGRKRTCENAEPRPRERR